MHFAVLTSSSSAQWLRDTANQFAHYHTLLGQDKELATLVKAVINNEARYVSQYPYCGAFQPPPESGSHFLSGQSSANRRKSCMQTAEEGARGS